jgi:hypothetical protein
MDPTDREIYPVEDRERQGRAQAASLRVAYGAGGPDSRAGQLVRCLVKHSAEFGRVWEAQNVATRFQDHKTLIHRELGAIELDCQTLYSEDQSQTLLVLTAAPRSEAAQKLELLAVLGTQRFGEPTLAEDRRD